MTRTGLIAALGLVGILFNGARAEYYRDRVRDLEIKIERGSKIYSIAIETDKARQRLRALETDLAAARRSVDVEYFARQCDREKREMLDRCGVHCLEANKK